MTKFLIQFSLIFCISILADDHIDANAKFSECQGKVANYYLSNLKEVYLILMAHTTVIF